MKDVIEDYSRFKTCFWRQLKIKQEYKFHLVHGFLSCFHKNLFSINLDTVYHF